MNEIRLASKVQRTAVVRCSRDAQSPVGRVFSRDPHRPGKLHREAVYRVEIAVLVAGADVLAEDHRRRAEIAIRNQLTCGNGERAAKCQCDPIKLQYRVSMTVDATRH